MLIEIENTLPIFSIFQVTGKVGVSKIFPISDKPTIIKTKPTKTIEIKGQLFTIYLKSMLDNFHIVFKFCLKD